MKRFHHGHALAMQHNPPSRCASSRPPAVHSCIPSRGLRAFTHQHHTIIRGHSHRRPAAFAAQDVRVRPSLPVARPSSSRRSHPRPPCGCSEAERSTFSFLASQWTGHPCAIERRRDALLPASFGGTVLLARFALHHTRHTSDSFRLESSANPVFASRTRPGFRGSKLHSSSSSTPPSMGHQNEPQDAHPECAHTGRDYFHRWPHVNWTLRLPCSAKRELSPHAEHRYARSLITYTHMTYMANGAITRLPPGVTAGATASALRICRRLRKAARAWSLPLVPSAAVRTSVVNRTSCWRRQGPALTD